MNSASFNDCLPARVKATIEQYGMFADDEPVMAAVSGGLDSMVMLHVLLELGFNVAAVHFDHHTRDGESAADAAFVKRVCAELGVPLITGEANVIEEARRLGYSFEGYARERRYAFLLEVARQQNAVLVTAHHETDQAETMLMGLLGLASDFGISGIAPVSVRQGVRIARPMLACSRETISAWAQANNITWREDHTNRDVRFTRNRVRNELLPLLEQYGAHARRSIARRAESLRSDMEYLDALAVRQLDSCIRSSPAAPEVTLIDRERFNSCPEALRRHMIKVLASRLHVCIDYDGIMGMTAFMHNAAPGKQKDFGGGVIVYADKTYLHVTPPGYGPRLSGMGEVPLIIPGETPFAGYRLITQLPDSAEVSLKTIIKRCSDNCQYFDLDALTTPLRIRARRPGDRMRPSGMSGYRKIKDIMNECGIPRYLRDSIPLVVMGDEILWLSGCRRGHGAMLTERSKRILEIRLDHEHQSSAPY